MATITNAGCWSCWWCGLAESAKSKSAWTAQRQHTGDWPGTLKGRGPGSARLTFFLRALSSGRVGLQVVRTPSISEAFAALGSGVACVSSMAPVRLGIAPLLSRCQPSKASGCRCCCAACLLACSASSCVFVQSPVVQCIPCCCCSLAANSPTRVEESQPPAVQRSPAAPVSTCDT
jgi:hypothetical protein